MEEAEAEDESSIGFWLLTIRQHAIIAFHHGSQDIGTQALGRFIGHLHTILQQQGWELLGGHGGQPEPVVVVRVIRVHLLADSFKFRKPADGKMAVAQQDPSLDVTEFTVDKPAIPTETSCGTLAVTTIDKHVD
jgi:hypothetical protein